MPAEYFAGEDAFKEAYQRDGLKTVLKSVDRELEDIQAMVYTVSQSLKGKEHNEHLVANLAGDMASELQYKLEKLKDYLCKTQLPVILEVPNPHLPSPNNQVRCTA